MMQQPTHLILNPAAGGGRARRVESVIRRALDTTDHSDVELALTEHPGHAERLAAEAAESGYARVVAVGGDGTVNEVVNGLLRSPGPPPLGVVPVGTGNDFARTLGLPKSTADALELALAGTSTRSVDAGRCGERYFLNVAGLGYDARVAATAARLPGALRIGPLPFVTAALIELLRHTSYPLEISLDGRTLHRRSLMVAIANGQYYAGGMMIAPGASLEDGLLDVCIAGDVGRLEVLGLLPQVFSGGHVRHPKVEMYRARSVRVEGPSGVLVEVDGEVTGTLPAELSVRPAALNVVVPDSGSTPG